MADLDDFFAKKDRKKAKGKKFTTTEEIAKKLEETGKRVEKVKLKEKPPNTEEEETQQPAEVKCLPEDEEWKAFEEEKKDYTGLKLGNLQVNDHFDADTDDDRGTGDNGSDGESGEANSKQSGPWKKADAPKQPEVETPAPAPPPSNVIGGVYKPPHLKNQSASTQSSRPRMKNVAPDIRSEEYFPTLNAKQPQAAEVTAGPWGRRKREEGSFEEVRNRGGSRSYGVQDSQSQAPQLSLDNKYGSLQQDQS